MLAITYIGHATTLIEFEGVTLLTDPNFGKRVFFAKRIEPLTYDPGKLPDLSAIATDAVRASANISSTQEIRQRVLYRSSPPVRLHGQDEIGNYEWALCRCQVPLS